MACDLALLIGSGGSLVLVDDAAEESCSPHRAQDQRVARQAQQPDKRPACWRVFHRVTYVSRVLPPLDEGPAPPDGLDRALQTLDIDSNYELIKALEPYVQGHTSSYGDLAGAVRRAVTSRLPDLIPHIPEILSFLALYYGVPNAPALDGPLPG